MMAEQELSQDLSVEERIFQLLQHLGIPQAHFGARSAADWTGLAAAHPEVFSSLTLVGPIGVDLDAVGSLVSKLLVFNGDQGAPAARVNGVMEGAPAANLVTLQDYVVNGWADVTDHTEIIAPAMTNFFQRVGAEGVGTGNAISEGEGEFAGISYRIRGSGPPVVLFPMFLSPTQWEPLVPRLSE